MGNETAKADSRDFEDNLPLPSRFSRHCLKGRCLNGWSNQALSAEWVFQRAVNKTMHCCFTKTAWYSLRVDGNNLRYRFPALAGLIVTIACLLSPLIFPIVYGLASIALTLGSPYTFYKLRTSFRKSKLERKMKLADLARGPDDNSEEFNEIFEARHRFGYSDITYFTLDCIWRFVCAMVPWLVITSGLYTCLVEVEDVHLKIHTSPIVIFGPWAACAMAAFRYTHQIHVSACDCSCEEANHRMLQDKDFGSAMAMIIMKLSDNKDDPKSGSFFPIFVSSEDEEPPNPPFSYRVRISLVVGACLHGLLPQLWMSHTYEESFPFPWTATGNQSYSFFIIWLGIIAPAVELRNFLRDYADACLEFEECAKQLEIFNILSSKRSQRERKANRKAFRALQDYVRDEQDRYHGKEKSPPQEPQYGRVPLLEVSSPGVEDEKKKEGFLAKYQELKDLHEYQIAFNFSTKQGIMLYRHMRTWLCTDILNERSEIEWYVTMSVQVSLLFVAILAIGYMHYDDITAMWTVFPLDIFVLSFLLMRGLNTCVKVNQYLFDDCNRILLDRLDEVGIRDNYPESHSMDDDQYFAALGWIWDANERVPKLLDRGDNDMERRRASSAPDDEQTARRFKELECARLLETTMQRIERVEERQKILGLEVTPVLRNRIAASLLSVLFAMASKLPELMQEHALEIKAAMHILRNATKRAIGSDVNGNHTFHG